MNLTLEDGIKKLQELGIGSINLSIKPACFPNSSKIRYISAGCIFYGEGESPSSYYFPGEDIDRLDSRYNMCFDDAPKMRFNSHSEGKQFIQMYEPFLDEHAVGRYRGTAKERCNEIKRLFDKLSDANIFYNIICHSHGQEIREWILRTAD